MVDIEILPRIRLQRLQRRPYCCFSRYLKTVRTIARMTVLRDIRVLTTKSTQGMEVQQALSNYCGCAIPAMQRHCLKSREARIIIDYLPEVVMISTSICTA